MKKKIIATTLLLCVLLFQTNVAFAENNIVKHQDEAEKLSELGLFKGTNNGFELDRTPTRVESAVMLVRLLGKEDAAKEQKNTHPFIDVPAWANDYVGYLYMNGLTTGIGENKFGSDSKVSWKDYVTFILRSLGYSDKAGDFKYTESLDKAMSIGLITKADISSSSYLLRDDMVNLSYTALLTNLKDKQLTLANKLINEKVFDLSVGIKTGVIASNQNDKLITLNFSDYSADDFGHKSHTLKINRDELPQEIKGFYKIGIGGIGKAPNDIEKYIYLQTNLKYKDNNLKYIDPYTDNGISVTCYDYSALFFYDSQNKPIGVCYYPDVKNGSIKALCHTITDSDYVPPKAFTDIVNNFSSVIELSGGFKASKNDVEVTLTIDYKTIIGMLPNACYFDIMTSSDNVMTDYSKYCFLTSPKNGRYALISAEYKPLSTGIQDGYYPLVAIYDKSYNIIAYKFLNSSDFS